MSVRNRYASNCTKVAPFPPSSRQVAESRIASKKRDDKDDVKNAATFTRQKSNDITKGLKSTAKTSADVSESSRVLLNTSKDNTKLQLKGSDCVNNKSRTSAVQSESATTFYSKSNKNCQRYLSSKPANVTSVLYTKQTNDSKLLNSIADPSKKELAAVGHDRTTKGHSDSQQATTRRIGIDSENKEPAMTQEQNIVQIRDQINMVYKRDENFNFGQKKLNNKKVRRHSDSQCELKKIITLSDQRHSGSLRNKYGSDERPKSYAEPEATADFTIFRPKSARPSSRWERRFEDDMKEASIYANESVMPRPKSARPESRLMRSAEMTDTENFARENLPPRPTTSRGWRSSEKAQHNISGETPDTYGTYNNPDHGNHFQSKSNETNKQIKSSNIQSKSGQAKAHDKSIHGYDPYSFRQEQIKVLNAKDVLDLNSGIDDIDLDIDPVVYFMQDDDSMTSSTNKPLLSQDAITVIGKVSSEENPLIGFHSGNVNRQRHKSDSSGSCYKNKNKASLHKANSDSVQYSFQNRQYFKGFSYKQQKSKTPFRPHAYSDSSTPNNWPQSTFYDSISENLISKYTTGSLPPQNESRTKTVKPVKKDRAFSSVDEDISLRKPRKLQPLPGRHVSEGDI